MELRYETRDGKGNDIVKMVKIKEFQTKLQCFIISILWEMEWCGITNRCIQNILIILKENGAIAIVDSMFYNSARWRKKRKKILKRDKYMCQIGIRYGKRVEATVVHHIYPRDEYPEYQWCDWNLISVSAESHNKLHDRVTNHLTQIGENLKRRTPPT